MDRRTPPVVTLASRPAPEAAPRLRLRAGRLRLRARAIAVTAVLALALGTGGAAGADSSAQRNALRTSVDRILADKRLAGASSSVVISDAASGHVLYGHHPLTRLMPASNIKLLTAAAAMDILGPGYRFHTDALARGARHGNRLEGDLYLRGTGDPTLLAKDYDALAAKVAASGIRKVTGDLVADDTRFDAQRLGASWAADDESAYYSSQISALSLAPDTDYDAGCVLVKVTPGREAGDPPTVKVSPADHYVKVKVTGTTRARNAADTLTVDREHGGNTLTVSGGIPAGSDPDEAWTSVWEPTGYAASVFADALARHGVHIMGRTALGRATPHGARLIAGHPSMPLTRLYVPFLKLSNNNHAEVLTKAMGYETAGEGSWSAGLKAIGGFLEKEGVDTGTLRQTDGSGLSRMDNVPAGEIATLLHAVRKEPWFKQWYDALPIACEHDRMTGGTLRSRMCGTRAAGDAHAKTGSLTGGSALSGYVTDADGRQLAYSILLNNYVTGAEDVENIEDSLVTALASYSSHGKTLKGGSGRRDRHPVPPPAGLECSWTKPAHC